MASVARGSGEEGRAVVDVDSVLRRLHSSDADAAKREKGEIMVDHLQSLYRVRDELDAWGDFEQSESWKEHFPESIENDKNPGIPPHPLWLAVVDLQRFYPKNRLPKLTEALDAWGNLCKYSRQHGNEDRITQRDLAVENGKILRNWVAEEIERLERRSRGLKSGEAYMPTIENNPTAKAMYRPRDEQTEPAKPSGTTNLRSSSPSNSAHKAPTNTVFAFALGGIRALQMQVTPAAQACPRSVQERPGRRHLARQKFRGTRGSHPNQPCRRN